MLQANADASSAMNIYVSWRWPDVIDVDLRKGLYPYPCALSLQVHCGTTIGRHWTNAV